MNRNFKMYLEDILQASQHILTFVEGIDFNQFLSDVKTSSAVIRQFEVIGEAAKNIPDSIKKEYSDIPWRNMAGMRDRLIHSYFGIDYQLIWDSIKENIPDLIVDISSMLERMPKDI